MEKPSRRQREREEEGSGRGVRQGPGEDGGREVPGELWPGSAGSPSLQVTCCVLRSENLPSLGLPVAHLQEGGEMRSLIPLPSAC